MSLETCPFCGKPFKRLKSHLPHCKMSPGSKTFKITNKSKEIPTTPFKHTTNKATTNKVNTENADTTTFKANSKSPVKSRSKKADKVRENKELLQNTFTLTSTASNVPSTEGMNTDTLKPKTKWLVKREQEMLKQAKLQTQTRIEFTSVSQKEKCNSETFKTPVKDTHLLEKEIISGQKQLTGTNLTSQLTTNRINFSESDPLQRVPWTSDCQDKESMPECSGNANVSDQAQNSPKSLTKECTLDLRGKEQGVSVFQTKTSVWDHIKHGLYRRRYNCVPVLYPIVLTHKVSLIKYVNTAESIPKPHTGNDQNASIKTSLVQFPILQTSIQKPVEDVLGSRLQNMSILPYSHEMATGYGGTCFFSSDSEISSNENVLKCQTSKASPQSQGWQWYYRKYIDVQKGGIGGIAMLIGSYCVLSYIWHYPNIKRDRWRKYH
ncbi:uncharacterized protein si:dkey-21c1.4 isoform X2 [Hemibagrus wyckioides]|uniref:uncharacterized protein si:dkey-21c1.4 isoform X2 n=1 Tax=Hemibagrus wyckioides TaxID=337641 RepID=UPI00266D22FF|nr:uncharacterized protein si:dkey-21c1.4 isoform X2 [Hemibagrus wyckioides]